MGDLEYLPTPDGLKGCYLVFDVVNEGTLFAVWGESVPGQVLACFKPNKPVPAFKYSATGKQELMRKFRGEKTRFYQGCAQFFKLAKEYDAVCWLTSPSIGVFLRASADGTIVRLIPGGDEPEPISSYSAVVVLSPATTSVVGGVAMMQEQFLRVGVSEGWGLAIV